MSDNVIINNGDGYIMALHWNFRDKPQNISR